MILAFLKRAAILLVLGLVPGVNWAQQNPPVTLQVAPKDLAIASGERRQVLVIATVTGSAVRKLTIRARPEPGTRVAIGKRAELPEIAPEFKSYAGILRKLLAKAPDQRYQTASELLAALSHLKVPA